MEETFNVGRITHQENIPPLPQKLTMPVSTIVHIFNMPIKILKVHVKVLKYS